MKSSKRANVINGWVVIDKAKNTTSSYVTARTKKILHAKKAGHAGTLDPLGTGVLPIALGEATKTISYVVDKFKHYKFTVRWGEERDSDDAEGAVINVSNERPCEEEIRSALCNFTGEIDQIPPRYSALKINGERAYKLARAGREFNLPSRKVLVKKFTLLDFPNANFAEFEVVCGKGTYIRSLTRDLGRKLGVFSHITQLRRIKCGPFFEKNAISLETLQALVHSAPPYTYLCKVESALDDIPALDLNAWQAGYLRQGRSIAVHDLVSTNPIGTSLSVKGRVFCAKADGIPVAIVRILAGKIHVVRLLKL